MKPCWHWHPETYQYSFLFRIRDQYSSCPSFSSLPCRITHMHRRHKLRHLPVQSLMDWLAHSSGFRGTDFADLRFSSVDVCVQVELEWFSCILLLFSHSSINHLVPESTLYLAQLLINLTEVWNAEGSLKRDKLSIEYLLIYLSDICFVTTCIFWDRFKVWASKWIPGQDICKLKRRPEEFCLAYNKLLDFTVYV